MKRELTADDYRKAYDELCERVFLVGDRHHLRGILEALERNDIDLKPDESREDDDLSFILGILHELPHESAYRQRLESAYVEWSAIHDDKIEEWAGKSVSRAVAHAKFAADFASIKPSEVKQ